MPRPDEIRFDGFSHIERGIRLNEYFRRKFLDFELPRGSGSSGRKREQKQKSEEPKNGSRLWPIRRPNLRARLRHGLKQGIWRAGLQPGRKRVPTDRL